MRLNCLGTVGYHPSANRHTSSYFLPESGILLDAGTGVFRLAPLIETDHLDVLLSHSHLDHCVGLTFLLDTLYQRPVSTLRIWGEQEKIDAIRTHLFAELLFPVPLTAQWCPLDGLESVEIGGATVTWQAQDHPGGSLAYRLDWPQPNKSLVYVTDTVGDLGKQSSEWKSNADLLLHECYFRDEAEQWAVKTGHCWTSRLIDVAQGCRPKQLLVTHLNPLDDSDDPVDLALIRQALDCPVALAEDGLVVEF